ncbi:hypothetical protein FQA39_LY00917 [Lamprigera yunnana]|nr:hypothetical protein FQA39_LY00917 [Lamprigera yunnana]
MLPGAGLSVAEGISESEATSTGINYVTDSCKKVPHQQLQTCLPNNKAGEQEHKEATFLSPRNFVLKYDSAHHSIPTKQPSPQGQTTIMILTRAIAPPYATVPKPAAADNPPDILIELDNLRKTILNLVSGNSAKLNKKDMFDLILQLGAISNSAVQLKMNQPADRDTPNTYAAAAKVLIQPVKMMVLVTPIEKTSKLTAEEITAKIHKAADDGFHQCEFDKKKKELAAILEISPEFGDMLNIND